MKSLFGKYIKEKWNKEIVEHQHGFITYLIDGAECYIEDIYVEPEQRKSGIGRRLHEEVIKRAKEAGCEFLTGTVDTRLPNSTESTLAILGVGFRVHSADKNVIYFIKGLK